MMTAAVCLWKQWIFVCARKMSDCLQRIPVSSNKVSFPRLLKES